MSGTSLFGKLESKTPRYSLDSAFDTVLPGGFYAGRFPRPTILQKLGKALSRIAAVGNGRFMYRGANLVQDFAPRVQDRIGPKTHILMAESCDWICDDNMRINLDFVELIVNWLAAGARLDIKLFNASRYAISCILLAIEGEMRKRQLESSSMPERISILEVDLPPSLGSAAHYVIVTDKRDEAMPMTSMWIEGVQPSLESEVVSEARLCEFVPWQATGNCQVSNMCKHWKKLKLRKKPSIAA